VATEKRLIDANEALERIKELPDLQHFAEWYVDYDGVCNVLKNAPTVDAVEVIRCKDCASGKGAKHKVCPLYRDGLMKDDDFCSVGERKDND
jgi:hypothetical protein